MSCSEEALSDHALDLLIDTIRKPDFSFHRNSEDLWLALRELRNRRTFRCEAPPIILPVIPTSPTIVPPPPPAEWRSLPQFGGGS